MAEIKLEFAPVFELEENTFVVSNKDMLFSDPVTAMEMGLRYGITYGIRIGFKFTGTVVAVIDQKCVYSTGGGLAGFVRSCFVNEGGRKVMDIALIGGQLWSDRLEGCDENMVKAVLIGQDQVREWDKYVADPNSLPFRRTGGEHAEWIRLPTD